MCKTYKSCNQNSCDVTMEILVRSPTHSYENIPKGISSFVHVQLVSCMRASDLDVHSPWHAYVLALSLSLSLSLSLPLPLCCSLGLWCSHSCSILFTLFICRDLSRSSFCVSYYFVLLSPDGSQIVYYRRIPLLYIVRT
jgi:hypothetical protein